MRYAFGPALAILPLIAASASGQWGWDGYHASTAAESAMNGMSQVVQAQGQYNLATSAAALNMTQVQRQEIENSKLWTETYFDMRRINREARAAEKRPPPTHEQLIRYAQVGKPRRLTPSELDPVSGRIQWPMLLTADDYAEQRADVEKAFSQRAQHGALGLDQFTKIRQLTGDWLGDLKAKIRDVPAQQYMTAKRFIESLAYEAGLPPA